MAKTEKTTRRGILRAGAGVLAGAALLPRAEALTPFGDVTRTVGEALREEYRRQVEALTLELRPRFKAGELRANTGDDWDDYDQSPFGRLEGIVQARFGLTVTKREAEGYIYTEGDSRAAHMVLGASPSAEVTDTGDWNHVCYWAREAAAWDVIFEARRRGYYSLVAGEPEIPDAG